MTNSPNLSEVLRQIIITRGPIPFREFMAQSLYHSEFGYYTSGRVRIGRAGDFFTNVSVGPLFGVLLARQFTEMWERLGKPDHFELVEQGAHCGDLSKDLLEALQATAPRCFQAAQLTILEPSSQQRLLQAATLSDFANVKVRWIDSLDQLPPFTGVHFSNELLDAFPIHLVTWNGSEWTEQHVGLSEGRFVFQAGPISCEQLRAHLASIPGAFSPGYTTEVNLAALEWAEELGGKLQQGFVLAIDYGFSREEYYRPERIGGTLTGYSNHQRMDELLNSPGEIDLTAHVDFSSLVQRAEAHGLCLQGYTDQHHFMVGLSRLHFSDSQECTPNREREIRAFKTLMHPTLMGISFKVLCLEKAIPFPGTLAGFEFARNSRTSLGLAKSPSNQAS